MIQQIQSDSLRSTSISKTISTETNTKPSSEMEK